MVGVGKISISESPVFDSEISLNEIRMTMSRPSISALLLTVNAFSTGSVPLKSAPQSSIPESVVQFMEDCEIDFGRLQELTRVVVNDTIRFTALNFNLITDLIHF
jgi:hypothetical protein